MEFLGECTKKGINIHDTANPNPEVIEGIKTCFRGILPPSVIFNELTAWILLKLIAQKNLGNYPNTLEEDNELMEKDAKEHNLTFNQRNCIIYRRGEKQELTYLIYCADKAAELSKLK